MSPEYTATGIRLDILAESLGISRQLGEPDALLRKRVMGLLENMRNPPGPSESKTSAQRFGQKVRDFEPFGELRRQKKAPHKEVLYIPVDVVQQLGAFEHIGGTVLQSINNSSNQELTIHVQKIGYGLEQGQIAQTDAEFLLDLLYAEIGRRVGT